MTIKDELILTMNEGYRDTFDTVADRILEAIHRRIEVMRDELNGSVDIQLCEGDIPVLRMSDPLEVWDMEML